MQHTHQACTCPCRQANFEDSNMNVGMPVFTIHGNHDDPAGEENLSAVSILSSAGLVNYFGKQVSPHWATGRLARPVCARCGSPSCSSAAFAVWQHLPILYSQSAITLFGQHRHHLQLTPSFACLQHFGGSALGKMQVSPVLIEKVRLIHCL